MFKKYTTHLKHHMLSHFFILLDMGTCKVQCVFKPNNILKGNLFKSKNFMTYLKNVKQINIIVSTYFLTVVMQVKWQLVLKGKDQILKVTLKFFVLQDLLIKVLIWIITEGFLYVGSGQVSFHNIYCQNRRHNYQTNLTVEILAFFKHKR